MPTVSARKQGNVTMEKTVTFLNHKPTRNFRTDELECWFRFSVIDSSLIGMPKERGSTHTLKVSMTDSLMNNWDLAGAEGSVVTNDMIKVAFQLAEEYIAEQLKKGPLPEELLPLSTSTRNSPNSCPYKISNIPYPEQTSFTVDVESQEKRPFKAVVLTALPVEYKAVRAHLIDLQEETHPQGTVYERGKFSSAILSWEVGVVEIGQGNPAAAMEAERAVNYFAPDVVLFVGIAGGIKDVALGDVVAATKVYGYESGKAEVTFHTRPEVDNSTYRMVQRAQAEARKENWLQRIQALYASKPRAFVAPIAAGEKVVASTRSDTYEFLRSNYGDALAVEMEGFGFLKAIHANPGVEALVVRGISDLIDCKQEADDSGSQVIAAQNASAFAFEILANIMISKTLEEERKDTPSLRVVKPHLFLHFDVLESPRISSSYGLVRHLGGPCPPVDGQASLRLILVNASDQHVAKSIKVELEIQSCWSNRPECSKYFHISPAGWQRLRADKIAEYYRFDGASDDVCLEKDELPLGEICFNFELPKEAINFQDLVRESDDPEAQMFLKLQF